MSTLHGIPPAIHRHSTLRALQATEILFRRGDKAPYIFEVERGRVQLIRYTIDSHAVVLHTAREGELFAEAALFASTYRCDAIAAIPSQVRLYPKRDLLAAFRRDPVLAEHFMAVLAAQIHALRARVEERNIRSARERVLHHLAVAVGSDGRTVDLEGPLKEVAVEIGLTHESLYRTLAQLEKDGAIVRRGRRIVLQKGRL
jgi:CRP/FNR family transcriptional regulator, dissimilatory nitrate respiration regulator